MSSRVSVGKTSPVPLGQQPANNSLPVVFAEDQPPIPVEEQNLVKSEVALSLLGIPRSEVALGIFADVNTYDVNPTEWAQFPLENTPSSSGVGILSGVEHIPDEAGARLVAPNVSTTVLTSKRFFRYQPGRVSSSTMGVKMNATEDPYIIADEAKAAKMKGAPSLKKWGIFDKFDGYYFEIANAGQRNDFRCVRRTQAVIPSEPQGYSGALSWFTNSDDETFNTNTNFGVAGVDPVIVRDGLVYTAAAIYDPSLVYNPDDVVNIDSSADPSGKLKEFQPEPKYALRLATYDGTIWSEIMASRVHQFPFDQSTSISISPESSSLERGYIRLDAHCNFYKIISNLNRKSNYNGFPSNKEGLVSSQWGANGNDISSYSSGIIDNSWDLAPSDENRDKKVWHLLVNTQGIGSGFRITDAQLQASTNVPNRSAGAEVTNGNVTLKEWFNLCVPAPYRMVYEWRPVRAMFSGDKLNGTETIVRHSDINTAANDTIINSGVGGAINRPGEIILTPEGEPLKTRSAYNVDFTKVTMWKIEFSWYGAVGAVFLCYVPISNNEARWVRVHHIRASNQHSVASLGNATLPITYLTHGGVDSGLETTDVGNTLVKYGASYYIDGGDKGTVRLLSKASDFSREVPKGFYDFSPTAWTRTSANKLTYSTTVHTTLPGNVAVGLMGAYLNGDSTSKVKWITQNGNNITLHFTNSSLPSSNATGVRLIVPRASKSLLTVRAKDFIRNRDGQPIRNRLQIYPVKYGAGITGGQNGEVITLKATKNPLFIITNTDSDLSSSVVHEATSGSSTIVLNPTVSSEAYVNTKNSTLPAEVAFATPPNIADGKYRYGYFLGTTDPAVAVGGWSSGSDPAPYFPVLGKLNRQGSSYFFEKYESYPEDVYIVGFFIPERHLAISKEGVFSDFRLSDLLGVFGSLSDKDQTKWDRLQQDGIVSWEDITRLSGVRIGQDMVLTPVSGTGIEILSYYASQGGYQFDLESYFAYNKEYLSFPLTDEVDIINFFGHYDISNKNIGDESVANNPFKVNNALTWEEQ
jgi:hypothetical protein